MRLLECYVESFGTLRDFHYSFDEGLNVLNRDNGFGKTTFSVFIKAMLYGLDDTKKTKLEENDRRHYMPWQGGVFGGWLTFTTGTLSYRVERTFGAKASEDTYKLYELETGKESYAYRDGLGERILGIDADGFERTVFFSERRLPQKSDNKSVSAKLSDLVGCDFDLGELDNALDMLEERRKYYYKKGGSGKIGEIRAEIADLDAEIARVSRINDALPEKERNLSDCQRKINETQSTFTEYSSRKERAKAAVSYNEKKNELARLDTEIKNSLSFFPNGVPDDYAVSDAESAYAEARLIRDRLRESDGDLNKRSELGKTISDAETLIKKFEVTDTDAAPKKLHLPLFITAGLLAVIGAILCFGIALAVGISLLALGAVVAICALIFYLKNSSAEKAKDELLSEAKLFLDRHGRGYAEEADFAREIREIMLEAHTEKALLTVNARSALEDKARLEGLEKKYNSFLSSYATESDNPFGEIRERISEYKKLVWKREFAEKELRDFIKFNSIDEEKMSSDTGDMAQILLINPDELKESLNSLRRDMTLLENDYRRAVDEAGRLDELAAKREELSDSLRSAEEKYKTINLTREHLNAAKDSLTTKYLGKTRAAFQEYISVMTGEAPELFNLSVDFGIAKSEGSVSKPQEAFSLGTREVYALAARLALADSLYDVDKPFIILDDPFVHLDDKRYAAASKIIKKIAAERQIIYLTCSKSRAIQAR